ncbi:MAG: glycerol-3-phosphate 1-O-acyltransferase PlsB [Succinivibrionaceae bacterium]
MLNLNRYLWYLPIKFFVKCNVHGQASKIIKEIDKNKHIVYIIQSNSISDLLTLEKLSDTYNLPSPFSNIKYNKKSYSRVTFIKKVPFIFNSNNKDYDNSSNIDSWIKLLKESNIDIQIVPITVIWNRNPGKDGQPSNNRANKPYSAFEKFFRLLFFGFDNVTIISSPIHMNSLFNEKIDLQKNLNKKCRILFDGIYKEILGPKLPNRSLLIQELLKTNSIRNIITTYANQQDKNYSEIENEVYKNLNEIVSDLSYHMIRILGTILDLIWNKLYHGTKILNSDRVKNLISQGHNIVYIPCHRSHMDYLLLSYALSKENFLPPHIVAGNNLNFFPINYFLKKCGAFFMRRKFKGDALYSTIFKEYLFTLFSKGYSTEFFIEGGRSRTGKMLPPRTGIVAMIVQSQLRGLKKPITLVPTYLGYEKVLEVNDYMHELDGAPKAKESFLSLFNIYKRFKYYGRGYISFGRPLTITEYLDKNQPYWKNDINKFIYPKPSWLFNTVNNISEEVVMRLNESATVNCINLCALAIISSQSLLSVSKLAQIISFYLFILKSSLNLKNNIIPSISGQQLISQALELRSFNIQKINNEVIVKPSQKQIIYLTYFRNNILHFFALPALISTIILVHKQISKNDIITHSRNIFYFLRHELYTPVKEHILDETIIKYLHEFQLNEYFINENDVFSINEDKKNFLELLSNSIKENLVRYIVSVYTLKNLPPQDVSLNDFIDLCIEKCKKLPGDITNNSPEFFDKVTFKVISETLIRHKYILVTENNKILEITNKIFKLINAVGPLLPDSIIKFILNKS